MLLHPHSCHCQPQQSNRGTRAILWGHWHVPCSPGLSGHTPFSQKTRLSQLAPATSGALCHKSAPSQPPGTNPHLPTLHHSKINEALSGQHRGAEMYSLWAITLPHNTNVKSFPGFCALPFPLFGRQDHWFTWFWRNCFTVVRLSCICFYCKL